VIEVLCRKNIIALVIFFFAWSLVFKHAPAHRSIASDEGCSSNPYACPFLVVGHRGAPYIAAENTLQSYQEAILRGANALEMDINITKDGHVVIMHDRSPDNFIALIRQAGGESLKYVPYAPDIGNSMRRPVDQLTLQELRANYGYAPSSGVIADIFKSGKLDRKAVIPTFEEFMLWARDVPELRAIILDIKLEENQVDLAQQMANELGRLSQGAHFTLYFSSPKKSIFKRGRKWRRLHPGATQFGATLFDFEQEGVLKEVKSQGINGLMTGKTILRGWERYLSELKQILGWRENGAALYPVISWTIDDQFRQYKLMQTGVDGILTNHPRDLARLVNRHFKDHSSVAKSVALCWQNNFSSRRFEFCTSGKEINPFLGIGKREVKRWVCGEGRVDPFIKDIFGCDLFQRMGLSFYNEIDNSGNVNIWYRPRNTKGVVIARAMEEYGRDKAPFVLEYQQSKCNDGFLNYDCEYKIFLQYLDARDNRFYNLRNANINYDSSFSFISNAPLDTRVIKVSIFETDDGKLTKSKGVAYLYFKDGQVSGVKSPDGTFKGKLNLRVFDYQGLHEDFSYYKTLALRYKQKTCNDGVLNYDCEYLFDIWYSVDGHEYFKTYPGRFKAQSSFSVYLKVPKGAQKIKIKMYETDDGQIAGTRSYSESILTMSHGLKMPVSALDKTFVGEWSLNLFDYDQSQYDSEGLYQGPLPRQ